MLRDKELEQLSRREGSGTPQAVGARGRLTPPLETFCSGLRIRLLLVRLFLEIIRVLRRWFVRLNLWKKWACSVWKMASLLSSKQLTVHVVEKKIPFIDENGQLVSPTQPNGYKFELLVLDMIHMMDNNLAYEVVREKEFAPIKNLHGVDSVDSARELLKGNGIEL